MIVLLGGNGYIGQEFRRQLVERDLDYIAPSHDQLDALNFDALYWYLKDDRPYLVINAAGYAGKPNVDACEKNKEATFNANVLLPVNISHACLAASVPWIHVSSGCIYNGSGPFSETDAPNFSFRSPPCSYYSGTKAQAEELIVGGRAYVCRLRIPFDERDGPRNYMSKIQRYARVYNAVNSLSHRADFVRACLDLWKVRAAPGIYNVTNPGSVSTRQVVELIRQKLNLSRQFDYWNSDEEFYQQAAATPRSSCVLDVSKLLATGVRMRPVEEALADALDHWKPE